ncbi:hypothetical protein [Algisphaera agarilytica]|uniref:Methyl-accepting chemotaxis protein n=1 Tax=Algisphaera agarilytica TaxID=1385975 RepID=A0A7X0LKY4_9BACT|nr:hypothetical protein [Algisphaera agarilytica]MBB6430319.1 methyl-accepting chemotaxis protein [Algisphaera agarilytica]
MTATQRTIGRARRRLVGQTTLRALGWSLLLASAVAAAAVVATQSFGVRLEWWAYATLGGVALLVAILVGVMRRPEPDAVAVLVDDRLNLKDKLGTSLYAVTLDDNELTRQVIDDAERAAASANVGEAFPVRPTKVWAWALGGAAVVALLTLDPLGLYDSALQRAEAAKVQAAEAQELEELLAQAKEEAEKLAAEDEPEAQDEDAAAMDPAELEEQLEALLTQKDLSNPEDQREAAAEVSDLQEKFEEAVAQQQAAVEALQNTMSQIDPGETGPADRFADALRRGDFSQAQEELAKLADELQAGDLSESQQEALAEQMSQLSEQLEQLAEQQQDMSEQAEQAAQQAMENAGMSQEQMDQLAEDGFDPEAVQQALQQALEQMQGMSAEEAQQMAEQLQQQMENAMQQAQNSENAGDAAEQLSQAMQQMSQAMQEQTQQNQQLSDALQQMQQELSECAGEQGDLQDMQSANQKLQEALEKLAGNGQQPGEGGPGQNGQGQGGQGGQANNGVGPGWGHGSGGDPLGDERAPLGTGKHASSDIQEGNGGRVIASWTRDGQMAKGESTVTFNQAVTEAKAEAERAVTEERVPKRYQKSIKDYFGNLPDSPEAAE